MATSKQLSDIRRDATALRSALNAAQSCVPSHGPEQDAHDAEWHDTLFALSKLAEVLAWTLADGGADIDAQKLADKLGRYRKYLEGEQA